jgi:hypothetical protein
LFGQDRDLDAAFLDIEHGIPRRALREQSLIFTKSDRDRPTVEIGENKFLEACHPKARLRCAEIAALPDDLILCADEEK